MGKTMNNNKSHLFKRSILALAVVTAFGSTGLYAQENENATQNDDEGIERIYVTASKRLVGLQESPVAVTVVGSEAIEQTKIMDLNDLQSLVPTLRVTTLQRSTNTNFSIRGFGNGANNTGIEPSVGVFIDGVYRSRAAAQIADLPRLEQIEVLSGPQSTLFGKNASAGVINVRTKAPSQDFEGKVEAGIGNDNLRVLKGYVTNSLTDTLSFSLSGGVNLRDGYTDSISGMGKINDRDRWNIRGQGLYQPNEDVTVRLIADYGEIDEACCTVADIINGPTTAAVRALGGIVQEDTDHFAYQSALNMDPSSVVEDGGLSLHIDIDYDGFTFNSITATRSNESPFSHDIDYTSLDIISETANTKIDTFTQEFRLTSTGTRQLDWMFGAFYFNEDVVASDTLFYGTQMRQYFDVLMAAGGAAGLLAGVEGVYGMAPGAILSDDTAINTNFDQDNEAYSLFANFDYHLSDDFTATFGLSYTEDEKELSVKQTNNDSFSAIDLDNDLTLFGVPLTMIPTLAPAINTLKSVQFMPQMLELGNSVEANKSSDSKTTWSTRLAYKLNNNINLFATAATGFKASSWNLSRDTRPFAADQSALMAAGLTQPNQTYGGRFAAPEKSTVYELGMKARFKKGGLNVTLFDQTIKGFQSSIFKGTGFVLANAGQQSTQGIEFDSIYKPNDTWSFTFGGTLLDPIYDSFVGASGLEGPIDLSGSKPAGIHERTFTAGVVYNFEFDNGMYGYVRTDYIFESDVHMVDNLPESMTREVSTFNASAGLNFENGLSMQLWVRNLNNDEYLLSGFPAPIQSGSFNAYPNQPRSFGASISYEF
jgi:iron complex outermembrane receptor protein